MALVTFELEIAFTMCQRPAALSTRLHECRFPMPCFDKYITASDYESRGSGFDAYQGEIFPHMKNLMN